MLAYALLPALAAQTGGDEREPQKLTGSGTTFLPDPAARTSDGAELVQGRRTAPPTASVPDGLRVNNVGALEAHDHVVVAVGGAEELVLTVAVHRAPPIARAGGTGAQRSAHWG
ncbi:hypothetical protein ACWDUK_10935 [Streptomyces cellulosae]